MFGDGDKGNLRSKSVMDRGASPGLDEILNNVIDDKTPISINKPKTAVVKHVKK